MLCNGDGFWHLGGAHWTPTTVLSSPEGLCITVLKELRLEGMSYYNPWRNRRWLWDEVASSRRQIFHLLLHRIGRVLIDHCLNLSLCR